MPRHKVIQLLLLKLTASVSSTSTEVERRESRPIAIPSSRRYMWFNDYRPRKWQSVVIFFYFTREIKIRPKRALGYWGGLNKTFLDTDRKSTCSARQILWPQQKYLLKYFFWGTGAKPTKDYFGRAKGRRLNGSEYLMPRRIPDYPDAFSAWNAISSYGSIISVFATVLFGYIIYDTFVNGKVVANNPWAIPSYFTSSQEFNNESQVASSLEWALASPTPFHAFNMLPVQS